MIDRVGGIYNPDSANKDEDEEAYISRSNLAAGVNDSLSVDTDHDGSNGERSAIAAGAVGGALPWSVADGPPSSPVPEDQEVDEGNVKEDEDKDNALPPAGFIFGNAAAINAVSPVVGAMHGLEGMDLMPKRMLGPARSDDERCASWIVLQKARVPRWRRRHRWWTPHRQVAAKAETTLRHRRR